MPRNHGRVGNEGFSYFSETAFKNLEKAIQKLEQYNKLQQQMTKASAEQYQNMYITADKYAKELKDMGIDINSNIGALKRQYETEKEIYEQRQVERKRTEQERQKQNKDRKDRENEQKRTKIMQQWERDFQNLTSQASTKEIENQKALNKIKDEAIKKAEDLRLSETKRQKILDDAAKDYNKEVKRQNKEKRTESRKLDVANMFFGTTQQDLDDIKEGTYWWKFGIKVFSEAVNQFSRAVKSSIDQNYNSTENTLNRITASNRMSWSSGSFSFGDRSYTGYSQINNAINDQLWQDGLYDNIKNTDVIEAMAELTSSKGFGVDREKVAITAQEKAYQDTVIKYLVPYLDTANEAYEMLEMTIPRNVEKCSSYKYNI